MEYLIRLHVERLPEGAWLATTDDLQGLLAQGRTVQETVDIARDVARKLIEAQRDPAPALGQADDRFDFPLFVST
jgi:predicted RNase H-like HicB family nuclease